MIEDFDKSIFKKCLPMFGEKPVVFDVGAHKGAYTDFVLDQIPGADVYLFEPNPDLFKLLEWRKNAFPYAVADGPGQLTFFKCPTKNDELSSLYKRTIFEETGFEKVNVGVTSVDFFCKHYGVDEIDFLKVDVEGAEKDVISGCANMLALKKIKFIQFEYGSTYLDSGIHLTDIITMAGIAGYKTYELIADKFNEVTENNFVDDYRYTVFLLTYLQCS